MVWDLRLHGEPGGPTSITGTARFALSIFYTGITRFQDTHPRLRFQLIAWFTWATAMLNHRWTTPDEVPRGLPLPGWGWEGTEGW